MADNVRPTMLLLGIKALPLDKRKNRLDGVLGGFLELLGGRVLPFDTDAARHYAELAVTAKTGGWGLLTPEIYCGHRGREWIVSAP